MKPSLLLLLVGALGGSLPLGAGAATISGAPSVSLPGPSTGTIGPVGATSSPNNDNATAPSPNTVPVSVFFNALGSAEIQFAVQNSGGTTEVRFNPTFVNNTGQAWTGFNVELGWGGGSSFVRAAGTSGLDFDTPDGDPVPTSTAFGVLDHQPTLLAWSGGTVGSVGAVGFGFSVDVPDGLSAVNPAGLNLFTLRATPVVAVPEPTSLLLMAGGLAILALRRRRG